MKFLSRIPFEYRITILYAIIGFVWIYLSDSFFASIFTDVETITKFNILKGGLYVTVTSLLLFCLVKLHMTTIRKSQKTIHEHSKTLEEQNIELTIAKEKAESNERLKTVFLQNISHQIRTPMNAIIGFSDLLQEQQNNPETISQYSQIIHSKSYELLDIINNIVYLSRIESGEIELDIQNYALSSLFPDIESLLRKKIKYYKKEHLSVSCNTSAQHAEVAVKTDKDKFLIIISHLVDNACKYTQEGSISVDFSISEDTVTCSIADTGIGISEGDFKKIFTRFTQIESPDMSILSGSGIGLCIAKELLELLGGTIWLTSEVKKGSTFYISIPRTEKS